MADVGGIAGDRLKSFVQRIERMDEEIKGLNADKSDVYKEAKSSGFDVKILRKVILRRRKDDSEIMEEDELVDLYERAIGTPVATRARAQAAE